MLAKVLEGVMDPSRFDVLEDAVTHQLLPRFLAHEGAKCGYWMLDPSTGHVASIALWDDADALRGAAHADGVERCSIFDRISLRLLSINTMPVLAARILAAEAEEGQEANPGYGSLRLTRVEGVARSERDNLHQLYQEIVADQLDSAGFRGSYWFGEEASGEGLAVSLWQHPADLAGSTSASRRRRRRVARSLGCRIGDAREYQMIGWAENPEVTARNRS